MGFAFNGRMKFLVNSLCPLRQVKGDGSMPLKLAIASACQNAYSLNDCEPQYGAYLAASLHFRGKEITNSEIRDLFASLRNQKFAGVSLPRLVMETEHKLMLAPRFSSQK